MKDFLISYFLPFIDSLWGNIPNIFEILGIYECFKNKNISEEWRRILAISGQNIVVDWLRFASSSMTLTLWLSDSLTSRHWLAWQRPAGALCNLHGKIMAKVHWNKSTLHSTYWRLLTQCSVHQTHSLSVLFLCQISDR